ncbi:hybrid sensor histidine kinase/response regulator transcription factor [Sinomicrobium soli]|uniref:hybrid sensor histidine kinase/response regulator transcription factor n=1 Tax=Sinomicrobium sp. N-1-3-6 TaxID=2219864 RepID=UPI000DCCFC45|nr:hybrid sensor histidine kinase/response regulator transcription factor [Sinomicrobium sp. N-1-3-6]RAV28213.1 hypothetical protein DN748_14680 [Sinomicrobium sp. N-1-3-6]
MHSRWPVFIILLFFFSQIWGQEIRFRHIAEKEGLRYTWVWDIMKDSEGFIWCSTQEGAFRYDGLSFEQFNARTTPALRSDRVNTIYEDHNNTLWFATGSGLSRYNRQQNTFTHFNRASFKNLPSDNILYITEDREQRLWIATTGGLCLLDTEDKKIISPVPHTSPAFRKATKAVTAMLNDSQERLWIGGTDGHLWLLNPDGSFKGFPLTEDKGYKKINVIREDAHGYLWIGFSNHGLIQFNPVSGKTASHFTAENGLPHNEVRDILEDHTGNIWIGSEKGIALYHPESHTFSYIQADTQHPYGLSDNAVYCMLKEGNGDIWIGTFFGGLNVRHNRYEQFRCFPSGSTGNSLPGMAISDIYGKDQYIYIGTEDNGLSIYDTIQKKFRNFTPSNSTLSYSNVHAVHVDTGQNLWVGTYTGGLNLKKRNSTEFQTVSLGTDYTPGFDNSVYCIFEDSGKNLWFGTRRKGLFRYDKHLDKILPVFQEELGHMFIWDILEDSSGNLWLATYGSGLYMIDRNENIHNIRIPVNNTITLYQDSRNNIWLGTEKEGLLILDEKGNILRHYTRKDGIPDNTVYAIIEDRFHHIWITTNYGISRIARQEEGIETYTISDGLPTNRFNYNSALKYGKHIYLGSTRGLVAADPAFEYHSERAPDIYLRSFSLFNETIRTKPGKKSILPEQIHYTDTLKLGYKQHSFSIDYTALTFWNSDKIEYAYRLDGQDQDWNFAGNKHKASYTNLSPGQYCFRIRTVDEHLELADNEKKLYIVISSPWYKTWWAYLLFTVLMLSLTATILYSVLLRIKAEHALDLERMEKRKMEEINLLKMNFFTNVSHEFKNPLSLISGPINQLITLKNIAPDRKNWYYQLIKRNADRLLLLLNELLEFKNYPKEPVASTSEYIKPHPVIEEMVHAFGWLAEEKKISFHYETACLEISIPIDLTRFEKILSNLLSNAFKFTPSHGYITIESEVEKENFIFVVKNSGKGIKKENLSRVFNRYFKEDNPNDIQGSGIGLAYVKSLVELHQGKITVQSLSGVETCFTVILPLREDAETHPGGTRQPSDTTSHPGGYTQNDLKKYYNKEKPRLLIVDDSREIRDFLEDSLSDDFNITIAQNGNEAFQKAQTVHPEIVISDVMMPKMDGYELCKKLKNNFMTSHVRIILLTALTEGKQEISGYKSGADAYISKPFNIEQLTSVITNLLIHNQMLKLNFQKSIEDPQSELTHSNPDEQLLSLAVGTVRKHMDDPDFNLEKFASEVGLSKTTLYRKLKAITGQSTNEFILGIRLKQAARLIKNTSKRISEISYEVGFSDPYYFSRAFKKHFGISPKGYRRQPL